MKFNILLIFHLITCFVSGQFTEYSFGEGFRYKARDTSFSINAAFRFQSLFLGNFEIREGYKIYDAQSNFLIRRSRLKFNGFAFSPKLKYKFELGLSNRDVATTNQLVEGKGANVILDAYLVWNFYSNFYLKFGQGKLPGNRERVISSGNMQLVDRSQLNSKFTLDRDIAVHLLYKNKIGKQVFWNTEFVLAQGEGRNVIAGNLGGGFEYIWRTELLPFGEFAKKGDYIGSAIYREQSPKLSIGFTADINDKSARTRGNKGAFILNEEVDLKALYTGFFDFMFKYKGFSAMGELVYRQTDGDNPLLRDNANNLVANYYTGHAVNGQVGYMFKNNVEIAGRYTRVEPQKEINVRPFEEYTLGLSKFIVGHKLKVQTDATYRNYFQTVNSVNALVWRVQFDFHL